MKKSNKTNISLSKENESLKKQIKDLQAEMRELKKNSESEDDDVLSMLFRLVIWFFVIVAAYPLFRLGWFILTAQMK